MPSRRAACYPFPARYSRPSPPEPAGRIWNRNVPAQGRTMTLCPPAESSHDDADSRSRMRARVRSAGGETMRSAPSPESRTDLIASAASASASAWISPASTTSEKSEKRWAPSSLLSTPDASSPGDWSRRFGRATSTAWSKSCASLATTTSTRTRFVTSWLPCGAIVPAASVPDSAARPPKTRAASAIPHETTSPSSSTDRA